MSKKKWCLLVQGGGMRCLWTAGAADVLLENHLYPDAIYGTSAGAIIGMNYSAKQLGRAKTIMLQGMNDKEFVDLRRLRKEGTILNFEYLLKESQERYPFDLKEFKEGAIPFYACCTNLKTYKPEYFSNTEKNIFDAVEASCSLIKFRKTPVLIDNEPYLDGGYIERIPFEEPIEKDFDFYVVLLSRDINFLYSEETGSISKPELKIIKRRFNEYPLFVEAYKDNKFRFNDQFETLKKLEEEGKAILVGPDKPIKVSQIERRKKVLESLYEDGRKTTKAYLPKILEALEIK